MNDEFKNNLLINSHIIADVFKKNPDETADVLKKSNGSREDMLAQFFLNLDIPVLTQSVILLNSIAKTGDH